MSRRWFYIFWHFQRKRHIKLLYIYDTYVYDTYNNICLEMNDKWKLLSKERFYKTQLECLLTKSVKTINKPILSKITKEKLNTDSLLSRKLFYLLQWKPFKMMKVVFYFNLKSSSHSQDIDFFLDFLVMQQKRLDEKDKINFKIYDVPTWLTNNYNTHIAQYFTK